MSRVADPATTRPVPRNQLFVGDAATTLRSLPDGCIDMVLTSPPYFRLRDYRVAGQLGTEQHVDDWVEPLQAVVRELRRVLTATGSLWLNLGDTYATHIRQGAEPKSLLLAPERLLLALVQDGWVLRNKVIWHKTNPLPSSVPDRFATTWEAVYLLTLGKRYHFDLDSLRVPHRSTQKPLKHPRRRPGTDPHDHWRGPNTGDRSGIDRLKQLGIPGHPLGKNPGDVWPIATSRLGHGHPAAFPLSLAERAIIAGCPEARCASCRQPWRRQVVRHRDGSASRQPLAATCGCDADSEPGLVLDPFLGSGTTALAAERLGRDWVGIEISRAFARLAEQRITAARNPPGSARASPRAA